MSEDNTIPTWVVYKMRDSDCIKAVQNKRYSEEFPRRPYGSRSRKRFRDVWYDFLGIPDPVEESIFVEESIIVRAKTVEEAINYGRGKLKTDGDTNTKCDLHCIDRSIEPEG